MAAFALIFILVLGIGLNFNEPAKKIMTQAPDFAPLQAEATSYLAGQPGIYGLYFIDLQSGQKFGYNASVPFHAASTFKVPMNLYLYYRQAQKNADINLGERLVFEDRHLEGGTGLLINQPPGGSFTIRDLARYSIIHSDNIATNILLERLGKTQVKDFMRDLGGLVVDDEKNTTCPADLALYLNATLDFHRTGLPGANLLLQDLFAAQNKERIPAPLPPGVKIANKIGTWPPTNTYHDMAYVEHARHPYILVITSKETPGYGETLKVIHHLSKMFYDYQTLHH